MWGKKKISETRLSPLFSFHVRKEWRKIGIGKEKEAECDIRREKRWKDSSDITMVIRGRWGYGSCKDWSLYILLVSVLTSVQRENEEKWLALSFSRSTRIGIRKWNGEKGSKRREENEERTITTLVRHITSYHIPCPFPSPSLHPFILPYTLPSISSLVS